MTLQKKVMFPSTEEHGMPLVANDPHRAICHPALEDSRREPVPTAAELQMRLTTAEETVADQAAVIRRLVGEAVQHDIDLKAERAAVKDQTETIAALRRDLKHKDQELREANDKAVGAEAALALDQHRNRDFDALAEESRVQKERINALEQKLQAARAALA